MNFLTAFILTVAVFAVGISAQQGHTADGKIAFVSSRNADFEIFAMNADGSAQSRLNHDVFDNTDPRWEPSSQTSQSGPIPAQALSGENQTPSETFEKEKLLRAWELWTIEVKLLQGDRVVVTYTSESKQADVPRVDFNVIDPTGDSIYYEEQSADGGTEFTAELSGSYELTFRNAFLLASQEVGVKYEIIPTLTPTATPTPRPTPTRVASTPTISRTTPTATSTPSARASQASTPQPTPSPTVAAVTPSPTPDPEPTPERGFFVNSLPTQGNSGEWDFMDPVALSIIGIVLTLVGTLVQLFRGR